MNLSKKWTYAQIQGQLVCHWVAIELNKTQTLQLFIAAGLLKYAMKTKTHTKLKEKSVLKAYAEGTRRLRSPKRSFNKYIKFAKELGITRVANITGLDILGIPTYISCRPNSRALSVSQGKGLTHESAQISALMESIETYHSERITLPLKLSNYNDLKQEHTLCNVEFLQKSQAKNFNKDVRIHWIEAYDYIGKDYKWIPFELVHTDYRSTPMCGHGFFPSSSNGLASGNHIIEAVIHGACEVIERDSSVSWFIQGKEKRSKTKVIPESINVKSIQNILERLHNAGIQYGIWDMTNEIGIPAFICRILPNEPPPACSIRPAEGMGCHPSKDVALLRALTEAAQSRLTFISGARDDLSRAEYQRFLTPEMHTKWSQALNEKSYVNYQKLKSYEHQSPLEDLDFITRKLKHAGLKELLIVDLTKDDLKIPVVRVVIPGTNGEFNPQSTQLVNKVKTFQMNEEAAIS